MRARNYYVHPNIRDHWALRYMNRCPDLVVCLKRDLQCLRLVASLVLIYRPNVAVMKGRVDLAQPVADILLTNEWSATSCGTEILLLLRAGRVIKRSPASVVSRGRPVTYFLDTDRCFGLILIPETVDCITRHIKTPRSNSL
ncbi:hypothetical protein TNCV_4646181 [Trichonephila clavipes]|nr:hypothetical protein TNCV_4646181 [Trichonephila clavipes]